MLVQIKGGALQVALFGRGHSGHDFHILGGLFFHNVHGVVEGDDAHHPAFRIHHRQGQEIVLGEHLGDLFLVVLGIDGDNGFRHDLPDLRVVTFRQEQVLDGDNAQQRPVPVQHIAGIDGFLIHTLPADTEDGLLHGHFRPQGHILHGHQGAGGVFGVAKNLIDGPAHFRVRLGKNPAHHIGGHFLYQVRRVIHIQLIQDFPKLVVRKALDQQLLGIRFHFYKGFRRLLLGKQTEHNGNLFFFQIVKKTGHVDGVHGDQDVPQRGILLLREHLQKGLFDQFKAFCHLITSNIKFLYWRKADQLARRMSGRRLLRLGILPLPPASMGIPPLFTHTALILSPFRPKVNLDSARGRA